MKKVVIVEDNLQLSNSLQFAISSTGRYQVVGTFNTGEETCSVIKQLMPDIIIMDIQLSGKMNGIECTQRINNLFPKIDILMLTVFEDNDQVFDALKAGASGYITKNASMEEIIEAMNQALLGGAPMSFNIARMVLKSFSKKYDSPLSDKENKVLNILANGGSYKTAANQLNLSVDTIKYHIKNIYDKLHVSNKEDAIETARKRRWI
ncbi:MAG: response regulator transcription factor [Cytophagaceae bacterium]|jgi:DNA-binding NarL/FixJ family response regulator|nr:response regulator transcription factor [Cytophagaceae bacterium]